MYRELSVTHPELVQGAGTSTVVCKGILEANRRTSDAHFDSEEEIAMRMRMAEQRYEQQLLTKRLATNRKIMPARLPKEVSVEAYTKIEYEMEDMICPVGERAFYNILKRHKVKWSKNSKPYNCPVCRDGPSDAIMLDNILHDLGRVKAQQQQQHRSEDDSRKLIQEQLRVKIKQLTSSEERLRAKQKEYEAHLLQFSICRPYVNATVANLKPGECMVFRDFVNTYAADGAKIGNLQLVVLYRLEEGGLVRQMKVSNFSRKPQTDWFFVRDVMDFHLKGKANGGSGLFDAFHTMWISGDHGSHFSAKQNIHFESSIFQLYSKVVFLLFLCSYHCYNRCDAAGVYAKKLSTAHARAKNPLVESKDYAMALMEDASCDAIGYDFEVINRNLMLLEGDLKDPPKSVILRKMCEFVFFSPGVFKCRRVPGQGKFIFLDLRPTTTDSPQFFCFYCSGEHQKPMYHESEVCEKSVAERFKNEKDTVANNIDMKASPASDPIRKQMLKGPQLTKKVAKRISSEENVRAKPFGCKVCDVKRYAKNWAANNHMKKVHQLTSEDPRLYNVMVLPKKAAKPKRKRAGAVQTDLNTHEIESETQSVAQPGKAEQGGVDGDISDGLAPSIVEQTGEETQDITQPDAPEQEVMNTEVVADPDNRATAADMKKGPQTRPRFGRACNNGVKPIIEADESESPSGTEDSSSSSDSDEGSDSES
jgi:hypothetical protein